MLAARLEKATPQQIRNQLGGFGFSADLADTPVHNLSGGEKARLLLALVTHAAPQLLILDEPTNHLDVDRRDALIQALNTYEGAVIVISHDAHLLQCIADRLWLVADGTCRPFDDDLDGYRQQVLGPASDRRPGKARRTARRQAAATRTRQENLRRHVRLAEAKLESLQAASAKLSTALADPETYKGPPKKANELNRLQAKIQKEIEAAEAAWLRTQADLEGGAR